MGLFDKSRRVPLLALLGRAALRLLWATLRRPPLAPGGAERLASARPEVLGVWHAQTQLTAERISSDAEGRRLAILASHSNDGELVTRIAAPFGIEIVRGSASRGGSEGLRGLYRATRRGAPPLLMPDGPRGPQHEVKPGAVVLAQMAAVPILPLHFAASRVWRLGSWDRMALPLPFSRVALRVGEPIDVPRRLGGDEIDSWRREVGRRLDELAGCEPPAAPGQPGRHAEADGHDDPGEPGARPGGSGTTLDRASLLFSPKLIRRRV